MCVWRAALFTILVAASFNLPVNAVVIQSRVVRRADVSARSQFYLSREDVEINMQNPDVSIRIKCGSCLCSPVEVFLLFPHSNLELAAHNL